MTDNASSTPFVSCIMPTFNRRRFVPRAIYYFLSQDYPEKELLILDDGVESAADLIPDDPCVRYVRLEGREVLGRKRNLACEEARGDIIAHWDDDDWMARSRLSYQVRNLLDQGADACGLDRLLFYEPQSGNAWSFYYCNGGRTWIAGGTLCYTKSFWRRNHFPEVDVGEDTRFVWGSRDANIVTHSDNTFYVAMIHDRNTSPKRTSSRHYRQYPVSEIRRILGEDLALYSEPAR
ncbi:MAG: hypothetical protein DMF61_15535 [Blastocatellia bacterium AA13]|nr:MAG: hypothetical protein DMF61_15535 [Blastocatellia bacterium AA13]